MKLSDFHQLEQSLIWDRDYTQTPAWQRFPVAVVRTIFYLYREFSSGELNLRAMSLVYTTILSLVPLLAFSFSVLKGFGVQNQVEPVLLEYFAALGPEKAVEISGRIVEFVNNIDVRVLGAVGLGLLVYTVVTLMQKIESAFNYTWHIAKQRSFAERFSTFISVLTVGPLLVFAALAITGTVMNNAIMQWLASHEPFGTIVREVVHYIPYLLVIGAFTFLYVLIPNTRVRVLPALIGGTVAGLLWETAGMVFAYFVATATKYQAVYATFGTAMFFMIWLYVSWLILLVGASTAYYAQHPRMVISRARNWRFSYESFEALSLACLAQMTRTHYDGGEPLSADNISERFMVPPEMVEKVLSALETEVVIARNADQPPRYLLCVPPEETQIADVVMRLRRHQSKQSRRVSLPEIPAVEGLLTNVEHGIEKALGEATLKSLVSYDEAQAPVVGELPTSEQSRAETRG